MNDEQVRVAQTGVHMQEWMAERIPLDFTHAPMTAVDTKVAATQTKLGTAISELGGKEAIQQGGGYSESASVKNLGRQGLEDLAGDGNAIAASIAEETNDPSVMDRFRMPHGSGDEPLKTAIRAMGQAVTDLGLDAEFEAHGLPNAATAFADAATGFQADEGGTSQALSKQRGATQAIKGFIKDIKSARKTFNAICRLRYKSDAETTAAWRTASHIEKVPVKKKKVSGSTPATPAGP